MHKLFRPCFLSLAAGLLLLGIDDTCHAHVSSLTALQCLRMQQQNTISSSNPVPCQRLAQVTFSYTDFGGNRHDDGVMVVLDVLADQVQMIFDTLLTQRFPLQQAQAMENFGGDDHASMLANNSSAFNGRPITGGSGWSKHAYGAAIDINPHQNPYLSHRDQLMLPPDAGDYVLRTPVRAGMAESVKAIFFQHGFLVWGGHWHEPTDYQHFEIGSRAFITQLLALPLPQARQEFQSYAAAYMSCMQHNKLASRAPDTDGCARQTQR